MIIAIFWLSPQKICSLWIRSKKKSDPSHTISLAAGDPSGVAGARKETRKTMLSFYPYKM